MFKFSKFWYGAIHLDFRDSMFSAKNSAVLLLGFYEMNRSIYYFIFYTIYFILITSYFFFNSKLTSHRSLLTTLPISHSPHLSVHSSFIFPLSLPHRSPLIAHLSSLTSHRSFLIAHLSSLTSHRSFLIAHFSSLISHRSPVTYIV